jgi:hypothetical protein
VAGTRAGERFARAGRFLLPGDEDIHGVGVAPDAETIPESWLRSVEAT